MHSDAWECWNCQARYWLDDQARLEYMVFNGLGHLEAEEALKEGYPTFAESQMA